MHGRPDRDKILRDGAVFNFTTAVEDEQLRDEVCNAHATSRIAWQSQSEAIDQACSDIADYATEAAQNVLAQGLPGRS